MSSQPTVEQAVTAILSRAPSFRPRIAIILGSGLGSVASNVRDPVTISYADLPGFPKSTVPGHDGSLVLGDIEGTGVAIMRGRFHMYEGYAPQSTLIPIRAMKRLGCEILLATNASGGIRRDLVAGSLMLIADHINLQPSNPLVGESGEGWGPRFPDMSQVYDAELARMLGEAARQEGIALAEGVYACVLGPSFETPAEIRALEALGVDAVGMSTVPEAIVARQAGMRIAALSVIANPAAGIAKHELSMQEVLDVGEATSMQVGAIVKRLCAKLGRNR